ncbi:alpha/beta hydrolase [Dyella mobilis]|uniref:Alpha/beta hydrolase n=1 Tax=Dyella mobilis TaxID=1849582 RepID=A0ABS2KHL4_9GAMM|nr:alpha/beta hydrolase [Dyella mobilis]
MNPTPIREHWIPTERGKLYAKQWQPVSGHVVDDIPIVLFHDSLGCVELWRDFPQQLADTASRTVIAYDRLGFGQSDAHPGTLGNGFIHEEARGDFLALRRHLGIGAFIAFGHSVGGGMAVGCAAEYPDDCKMLITESAQAFVEDRTIAGIEQARVAFQQPGQLERLKKYHGEKAAWALHAWIDTWLGAGFANWCLDEDLRRVACPVLAIHGDGDEYGSIHHPERIVGLSPGVSRMEIVEGCGHVPHREQPALVLSLLQRFI